MFLKKRIQFNKDKLQNFIIINRKLVINYYNC